MAMVQTDISNDATDLCLFMLPFILINPNLYF